MNPTPTLEDVLRKLSSQEFGPAGFKGWIPCSRYDTLLEMFRLSIEQRNDALNWAVDDMGRVIHELAPERDAELIKIARRET